MLLKKKKKSIFGLEKGFTLIELIIVIAIIGIVATVSWVAMSGIRDSANAQNACEQVASMINKTRNYALSGKTVGGSVPSSFRVRVAGTSVLIRYGDTPTTMETFSIPNGVICTDPGYAFIFSVPYGICTSCGSTSTINCSVGGATRTVTVTPNSAVCQ